MSEEQLARKRRLRAGHRASTTRILGRVEPATTADLLNPSEVNQLKRSLEEKLQCLSGLDQDILDLTPEESIEDEIIQADEIKERLYAALSKLDHCLSFLGCTPSTTPTTTPPVADAPTTDPLPRDSPAADHPGVELTATGRAKVKLP